MYRPNLFSLAAGGGGVFSLRPHTRQKATPPAHINPQPASGEQGKSRICAKSVKRRDQETRGFRISRWSVCVFARTHWVNDVTLGTDQTFAPSASLLVKRAIVSL